jgi:hypothetical protein
MTLSRPKSANDLPLHWLISMGSSTSMCSPSRTGTLWTRTNCTWTTARSSTSAHSTSPAPNPVALDPPTAWFTGIPDKSIRHFRGLILSVFPGIAPRSAEALAHRASGRTGVTTLPYLRARKPLDRSLPRLARAFSPVVIVGAPICPHGEAFASGI